MDCCPVTVDGAWSEPKSCSRRFSERANASGCASAVTTVQLRGAATLRACRGLWVHGSGVAPVLKEGGRQHQADRNRLLSRAYLAAWVCPAHPEADPRG